MPLSDVRSVDVVFVLLSNYQVVHIEEPLRRARYGRAYEEYCAHVPRWIPRETAWKP